MGTLRDLRYGQFNSRTLWVTVLIVAVVVGLFFIPEIIKFQRSIGKSKAASQEVAVVAVPTTTPSGIDDQRASVSSSALHELSDQADRQVAPVKAPARNQESQADVTKVQPKESFWSGWSIKVRARGGPDNAPGPKNAVSMQDLNSRDVQNVFGRARGDMGQFMRELKIVPKPLQYVIEEFSKALDAVASGAAKSVDQDLLRKQLFALENNVIRTMLAVGVDRGQIIKWGEIPAVHTIENSNPSKNIQRIEATFAPRILLRDIQIREQVLPQSNLSTQSSINAQYAVKGSDVEKIVVYVSGLRKQEFTLGAPDSEGYRTFNVNGTGQGVWTFVAYDKFGARPFRKMYMFLPQARRFSQAQDGTYQIAFRTTPSMSSLDRYFAIGSSRTQLRDAGIGVF